MKVLIVVCCILPTVESQLSFQCPSTEQWSFRSTAYCNKTHPSYHCLLDLDTKNYIEKCMKYPSVEIKGLRKVFAGNLHGIECAKGTYQPFKFWTNATSDCIYKKSLCNGDGQVVHDPGDNEKDQQCRCDYRLGYDYANNPKHKCYCLPSVEDCTCYQTKCAHGEILTQDYDCLSVTAWKSAFQCPELTVIPLVTPQSIKLTLDTSEDNNQNNSARLAAKAVASITGICMIGVSIILVCLVRGSKYTLNGKTIIYSLKDILQNTKGYAINVTTEDIPHKVKESQQSEVNHWKQKLKKFVPTRASAAMLDSVKKIQCVVITGPPGCGKTITAYHIVVKMIESEGYELLIVNDQNDAIKYVKTVEKQLLFIDNLCGKKCIDNSNAVLWWEKQESILTYLVHKNKNLKILATCRSYIFNLFRKMSLFCERSFLNKDVVLNITERRQISEMFLVDTMIDFDDEFLKEYDFFPALCSCEISNETPKELIPMAYMMQEIDILFKCLDHTFLLFALLVILHNTVNVDMFTNEKHELDEVLYSLSQEIGFSKPPSKRLLLKYLISLQDSYVIKTNREFSFISKNMFNVFTFCMSKYVYKSFIKFRELPLLNDKCLKDMKKEKKSSILHVMADLGYKDDLEFFGGMKCLNIDVVDKDGRTPLHIASCKGHEMVVQKLINLKADFNATDNAGNTPLFLACEGKHFNIAEMLLSNGAEIKQNTNTLSTPLHLVCEKGYTDLADLLLQKKVKLNAGDKHGYTGLHLASMNNFRAVCNSLFVNGAEVNPSDHKGQTALHHACKNNCVDVVKLLLTENADCNLEEFVKKKTPLNIVCEKGFYEITGLLIDKGIDIDHRDIDGNSSLYLACMNGHLQVAQKLLENNANVQLGNNSNSVPLHTASNHGFLDVVECLVEHNADLNCVDKNQETPLHIACKNGDAKMVELLLQKGASVDVEDKEKRTPLHIACYNNYEFIVRVFCSHSKVHAKKDKNKKTPLSIAMEKGFLKISSILQSYSDK